MSRFSPNGLARRRERGLTLIELMVVIVILAILATIALPLYERYQRGARRADGKAALTAVAHAQERAFSVYQRYVALSSLDDWAGLEAEIAGPDLTDETATSPKGRYTVTFSALSPTAFTVQAVPNNWTDPDCGDLQLTSTGQKVATGPKGADYCW